MDNNLLKTVDESPRCLAVGAAEVMEVTRRFMLDPR